MQVLSKLTQQCYTSSVAGEVPGFGVLILIVFYILQCLWNIANSEVSNSRLLDNITESPDVERTI